MEKNLNTNERRPYVKPEGNVIWLELNENIAASIGNEEFNGEDDAFA